MCDFCQEEGWGGLKRQYVLTKETSDYHGTYYINRSTEMARVWASVCERCYQEKTGLTYDLSTKERGLWASLKRWYNNMTTTRTIEQMIVSIARNKLDKLYPAEVSKALGLGREMSFSWDRVHYQIQTAESWEARLKANR